MLKKYEHWFFGSNEFEDPLTRKRSLILLYILSGLSILVSLEWVFIMISSLVTEFPVGLTALGLIGILAFYRISRSHIISTTLVCLFCFIMLYSSSFNSGGSYSFDLLFLYVVPMMGFLLAGKRIGLMFSGLCLIATLISFFITNQNIELYLSQRTILGTEYYLICAVMLICIMALIAYMFADTSDKFSGELIQKNSHLKLQATELEKAKTKILESNTELEQYAYVTSHDLKQPLKTISCFTRLLELDLERKGINGETIEYLNFINQGTQNMEKLINDLLVYARLNSNKKDIFQKVNLYEVLGAVLNSLQDQIVNNNVSINISDGYIEDLSVIPTQIFQLFQNLISNAIKYRDKSRALVIDIGLRELKKEWICSIQDNGIGIDKKYHDEIFKPFKRIHQTEDEYQGSGIGLATCTKILKKHKGRLWVDSKIEFGSTFYFSIPKKSKKRSIKPKKAIHNTTQSVAV